MAITRDWTTKTFFIPQGDLTNITGSLYELNTETDFRQEINAIMASEEGIVFDDPIVHNTEVTVAGTTFARTIEVVNGYNLTFTPDTQWTVRLTGSNNNLFDVENGVLNQNQVQVISNNSGGLVNAGSSGLTPEQEAKLDALQASVDSLPSAVEIADAVWDADIADYITNGTMGERMAAEIAMITDLWQIEGLDKDNPMTVTTTSRRAGDVDIIISGDGITTTTASRQ